VIVECMTENRNRTVPEMRVLFRDGQWGAKVGFLFSHVGLVEATHPKGAQDLEGVAIEAGAQDVEPLESAPAGQSGGRFITDRGDVDVVTKALQKAGWQVTAAELGYVAKEYAEVTPEQRAEVVKFLEALDDHDDVHRVYAALR
jgi:transcriptional/translational regulatory protein YebC/TACO1